MDFLRQTLLNGADILGIDASTLGIHQQLPSRARSRPPHAGQEHDAVYVPAARQSQMAFQQFNTQASQEFPLVASSIGMAAPNGPQASVPAETEKVREIERLKREMRKTEEKASFFHDQVQTLQQQLEDRPAWTAPVMSGAELAQLAQLRAELEQERARTRQFHAQLQEAPRPPSGQHGALFSNRDLEVLRARVQELEGELLELRSVAGNARPSVELLSVATPTRSCSSGALGTTGAAASPGHREFSQHDVAPHMHSGSPGVLPTLRSDPLNLYDSPRGPRRAVIVGCDYPGQAGALRAGVSDAMQWAAFFTKHCGMLERDVHMLSDEPAHYQQSHHPDSVVATRENILRNLMWLATRSTEGDQIFFVFCGLGVQVVAEEFAGQRLCENGIAPADVSADHDPPRVVSDTDVHKVLQIVPSGVQATLIYDCCHAGQPLDRAGLNYLTEQVNRGVVDYQKLRGHPVLPRFLEMPWKVRPEQPDAVRESNLCCQAVQWAACSNNQFCVELPIDDKPGGVFSYIFLKVLMKGDIHVGSGVLLRDMQALTGQLKGRWRLQQDVQLTLSHSSGGVLPFLR